jgi:hypothetical protein
MGIGRGALMAAKTTTETSNSPTANIVVDSPLEHAKDASGLTEAAAITDTHGAIVNRSIRCDWSSKILDQLRLQGAQQHQSTKKAVRLDTDSALES